MLKEYQLSMLLRIKKALATHDGVCAVLPCRSGKSYIIKEICDLAYKKGSSVLILAHRRLLIAQHKHLITNARVECVFTEVNHLGENGHVDLIVIDEAHLSGAQSYQKVCSFYHCKRILFTATATRLDGHPLNLCSIILNGPSGDDLIARGAIAPYDLYAPKLNIDLTNTRMSGSDFNIDDIASIMLDRKIYGDIIANYRNLAYPRQAIAYCTTITHAIAIQSLFNSNGIPAIEIDSTTPESTRATIMNDFKSGKYTILTNCNLISEGITLPECDCVLLLRPTQSESLFIQQSCRCLTPRPNKRAIIIDYVGNVFAHGMPTEPRHYSLATHAIRNSKRTADIIARTCHHCLRVYSGTSAICPYCHSNNGKTKKQIEEEQAVLSRIESINHRKEQGRCQSFNDLVNLGIKRGYKNPVAWASYVYKNRIKKI